MKKMQMNEMKQAVPFRDGALLTMMAGKEEGEEERRGRQALPPFISWNEVPDPLPDPPEEMIQGLLRRGHKMLVSGPSKAGKSFLLLQLSIAIAEGRSWLKIPCRQGKVLYVNLEIDDASCFHRVDSIYTALGMEKTKSGNLVIWNLRGHRVTAAGLVTELTRRLKGENFDVVILDPIYKLLQGNENSAEDISLLCREFDRLCMRTGCALIFSHHHSKGAQGSKRAMDRASGSGVFARDPDALLDLIQLNLPADVKETLGEGVTAWRMECSLREFPDFEPVKFLFEYPLHRVDESGLLDRGAADGSPEANLLKSSKRTMTRREKKERLDSAYDALYDDGPVQMADLAEEMEVTERTIRNYLNEFKDEYWIKNGAVIRV